MRFAVGLAALSPWLLVSLAACDGDEFTPTGTGGAGGAGTGALVDAGSISGLALMNPSCGIGDGGTVSQECVTCATEHCESDFVDCFGADWQTDLRGGLCSEFGSCVMGCACGDNDCFNACLQALDAVVADPCRTCVVELVSCEQQHCTEQCDTNTGNPDAGQGGGGPG